MKQPVWMLNSSLLLLFFVSQLLIFMMQRAVPRRISVSPRIMLADKEATIIPVDIKKIYEYDLFGTYQAPVVQPVSFIEEIIAPIPKLPKTITTEIPVEKVATFFPPLDVVLKGVIFVKDDSASCIAIVQLKKTKEEKNYQVGDLIEDAQILKIFSNRIIIIRSNGQQETLYLREEDALEDFNSKSIISSKSIVEHVIDHEYTINVDEFKKQVHNLGEFITLLDITTVYKQGKNFGCRIGTLEKNSIGLMLGFLTDDIIVKVDEYYVDDLHNRLQLYDHIMKKLPGDLINVVLYRNQDILTLVFGLIDNVSKSVVFTSKETKQQIAASLAKHESEIEKKSIEQATDKNDTVIVQTIPQDIVNSVVSSEESLAQNDDEIRLSLKNAFNQDDQFLQQNSSLSKSSDFLQTLYAKNIENNASHNNIMQEHENIMPALQGMRAKDRRTMIKQGSKNMIFNGMQ